MMSLLVTFLLLWFKTPCLWQLMEERTDLGLMVHDAEQRPQVTGSWSSRVHISIQNQEVEKANLKWYESFETSVM